MPLVGILLVIFTALHVLVVRRFWEAFSPLGKDYWWLYVGKFDISGFDPITYSVLSQWDTRYQVYRHPLLAFFAWPFSQLNQMFMDTLGMNPVQIVVAVILLACLVYSAVFLFRIFREHISLGQFDSTLLALLTFSFAYIMLAYICPDHFAVSMMVLVVTLYAAGKKMKEGTRFKVWQTLILFLVTAGITLSNGIKTFIAAFFTNRRGFFRPAHLLLAVIVPSIAIWFFARWEYQFYVFPREQQRKQIKAQRAANADRKAYRRFCDTIAIADTARRRAIFDSIQAVKAKKRKAEEAKKPVFAHQGKPIAEGEFTSWTDITTSRWDTAAPQASRNRALRPYLQLCCGGIARASLCHRYLVRSQEQIPVAMLGIHTSRHRHSSGTRVWHQRGVHHVRPLALCTDHCPLFRIPRLQGQISHRTAHRHRPARRLPIHI